MDTPAPSSPTPMVQTTPIPQQMNNLPENNSKKLLLAALGVIAVGIIIAVLILLNNQSKTTENTNPAPVISDALPDVAPPPAASKPGATVFEGKMFNFSFEYTGEITDDQTTKVTYADGTEKCFLEEVKAEGLNLLFARGVDCTSAEEVVTEETYMLTSKDGKEIDMRVINEGGVYTIRGDYKGITEGTEFTLVMHLTKGTLAELKEKTATFVSSLTYDNIKPLKTDRGDTIYDSGETI